MLIAKPYIKHSNAEASESWTVPQLCKAYDWPTGLAGGGVIAIIELGGGWLMSDMKKYFRSLRQQLPLIEDVSVDGTKNSPGVNADSDGEVTLDIQIAAAAYFLATGKPAQIRVYWTQDIAEGVRAATRDGCDVCSISWGADEADWLNQDPGSLDAMEAAAAAAVKAGMVVLAASGDNDSGDSGSGKANVDAPASCPSVVGCGGTMKTRAAETVWNDDPGDTKGTGTGGGYSTYFPPQPWQARAPMGPGRMVPDVAANADPNTGYRVIVDDETQVFGGTSCVAPLYAGLFAAFGTKLGFITPVLWANQTCFTDVTSGDNGFYRAGVGPDPCTGLGAPIGAKLAALFERVAAVTARRARIETPHAMQVVRRQQPAYSNGA